VGTDIQPGSYTADLASGGIACYWARMSSPSDIIDNDLSQGKAYVTIQPGDAYFKTSGCTDWVPA
jgi:hypothetical protein